MDGNTSQFSDYLSNINNQTGMTEESLLLSPIFPNHHSYQTAEDGETSPYAIDSKLLASSNIKRRRSSVVRFQCQSDEMTKSMDMDMNNQSDILNSPQFVKSNRIMVTRSDTDDDNAVVVVEGDKSRQWNESWNNVKSVSFQCRNESREEGTKGTTTTTTTPSWKRALDESACPSLGLGSIGTQSSSQSNNEEEEEHIMGKSLQLDNGISVDDDDDVDEHSIQNDIGQEEQGVSYVCCEDKDNCENEKQQSNSKDESGISFGSSLLNQSLDEESLQDSMQEEEQDENADNDSSSISIDKSHCPQQEEACDDMGNNTLIHSSDVMEQEEGCAESTTNISPHVSTRVTMSPKEENNRSIAVKSTLKDEHDIPVTPHSTSTDERAQHTEEEFTSPSASIEKIRLGLTPRLKKLQSKLIRESLQGQHVDESNTELDVTSSTTPITQKDKIRSSTDGDDSCNIVASELSLTPALKSFRSKLIRDSLSIGEFDDTLLYGLGSPYGHVNPTAGRTASMVPGKEDNKENIKPCNVHHHKETNRKRLSKSCPNTDPPRCKETNDVNEMLSPNVLTNNVGTQPQFLSPSLRQSTTTFVTSTSSKGRTSKRVVFEDDLYLDQPIDLSSAKKNLNAQSSALVERLRGAAQKRMMSITRTRDSLAKKETMQEQRIMNANKEEFNVPENGTALDECDSTSNKVEFGHDKKVTKQDQRPTGVPSVLKRPATVPISPKLGLRRDATTKVQQTSKPPTKNQTSSSIEKTNHDETTLYSRKTRSSTHNLTSAKRKPLTIPKSPLLGSRRNADQVNSTKPKASTNKLTHKSPIVTISKLADPISPMGLEFLSRSPTGTDDDDDAAKQNEQVVPFTLHTQLRAKERAMFEACRILNEKLRNEAISKDRERLLREKYKELERLKDKLS